MPSSHEFTTLAEAYLLHARTRADADFWAWEEVSELVSGLHATPEDAWRMVQALVAIVPADDPELIDYVAAGPVEELVINHGVALVDSIEHEAAVNPHFRAHLAGVWLNAGTLPVDVEARIVAASGGAIEPLPPILRETDEAGSDAADA